MSKVVIISRASFYDSAGTSEQNCCSKLICTYAELWIQLYNYVEIIYYMANIFYKPGQLI